MTRRPDTRSISLPIILSTIAVALSVALLIGWTLLVVKNPILTQDIIANRLLLLTGVGALIVIMTVLVLFSVFLVREIREVRRQTSFIDSVTHELKSPLAALKLCLETLSRDGLAVEQQQRLRGMMLDDIDRLSAFIDRILTANRLGPSATPQSVEELALAPFTQKIVDVVTRRARVSAGAVTLAIPRGLALETDAVALGAVLENLVDNAIKYSDGPPVVVIRARELDGKAVVIEVADRGIGIPRTHLRRVFERFYRLPEESVRSRRGTGLGLYVVAELVRILCGRIEARSPGRGQGTTMVVTLPRRLGGERGGGAQA